MIVIPQPIKDVAISLIYGVLVFFAASELNAPIWLAFTIGGSVFLALIGILLGLRRKRE